MPSAVPDKTLLEKEKVKSAYPQWPEAKTAIQTRPKWQGCPK